MRRAALLLLIAVAAVPTSAQAKFHWGVIAGEVTTSSAILWTRASALGKHTVTWGTTRKVKDGKATVRATKGHDLTLRKKVGGLKPDTTYYFRWSGKGLATPLGTFRTAPKPTADKTIEFGWSGDMDGTAAPGEKKPYWNDFSVLSTMAKEKNAFNIMLGDTIYSDTEVEGKEGKEAALTVKQKWAKYRLVREQANEQKFTRAGATYWHWDDHEFINDFSPAENSFMGSGSQKIDIAGTELYKRGKQAFLDYTPATTGKLGLYRKARWGKNLELFFLDERSFRSAKSANDCINPQSGEPDLAPTAPQRTRALFSFLVPSLSEPVSPACLASINNPERTMLGAAQFARFQKDFLASTAIWKVVVSEMEVKQYYALPYDRWEGYEAERTALLNLLQQQQNVVILATDVHANLGVDARFKTLEDGGPVNSGIFEMSTGPVATKNYNLEISDATGNASAGDLVSNVFLKPPPPDGIGMDCAATKVFSYGQVTVNATTLTIAPKDANGVAVSEDDGTPCGPFTFTAQ